MSHKRPPSSGDENLEGDGSSSTKQPKLENQGTDTPSVETIEIDSDPEDASYAFEDANEDRDDELLVINQGRDFGVGAPGLDRTFYGRGREASFHAPLVSHARFVHAYPRRTDSRFDTFPLHFRPPSNVLCKKRSHDEKNHSTHALGGNMHTDFPWDKAPGVSSPTASASVAPRELTVFGAQSSTTESVASGASNRPGTPIPGSSSRISTSPENSAVLLGDVAAVFTRIRAVRSADPLSLVEICTLLQSYSHQRDRIAAVTNHLLRQLSEQPKSPCTCSDSIFADLEVVVKRVPLCNPDAVYHMLESMQGDPKRVDKVVEKLLARADPPAKLRKEDSLPDDPLIRNDPIYKDMHAISKMFPGKDRNEIYAYVEAHHDKPDRVRIVIEELLATQTDSQGSEPRVEPSPKTSPSKLSLQEELKTLKEIFPDCDPNFLNQALEQRRGDPERAKKLAAEMFERGNYPRLKDVLAKEQKEAEKRRLWNLDMTVEDFLKKFPNPAAVFNSIEKKMGENYKAHCLVKLKNDFHDVKSGYLKKVLQVHNHHLTPAMAEIHRIIFQLRTRGYSAKRLRTPRVTRLPYPSEPDEFFFHEAWYLQHQEEIQDYLEVKKQERLQKVAQARARNELHECSCCFDDEILFEEMSSCADGHLFCCDCVRRYTESMVGESRCKFLCLTGYCEQEFPLSVIQKVLPPSTLSLLLRRLQEQEIQEAGIPDLVSCPFCSFATIMEDSNDKVFHCLNPQCLKESCRLCREPNHVPLRCDEVEKQGEVDMRTFIENRISEAMLRICPRCKKRFIKEYGCNKMTCICGMTMCYVCRLPGIDYDHFNRGSCTLDDAAAIHEREMTEAAKAAREKYLHDHPEAADMALKYDPALHLKDYQQWMHRPPGYQEADEDDDDEDGYYDEDDDEGNGFQWMLW